MKPMKIGRARLLSVTAIGLMFSIAPAFSSNEQLDKAVQEVEKSTEKHVQVLTNLLAKVPASAKPSIEHATAVSERGRNIAAEAVELSETNDPLERAALHRKHAEKRVVEIQAMQRKGKPEFAGTLAADYESSIDEARKEIDKAKSQGRNVDKETIALDQSASRHTQASRIRSAQTVADRQSCRRQAGIFRQTAKGAHRADARQPISPRAEGCRKCKE